MKKILLKVMLNLFDGNTNVTTDSGLSDEMKTFYETQLIRLAEANLVHDQFAQKKPIPKNGGKTIEFRRYDSLPKALTPLTEGVTPNGQKLNVTALTATVAQYGGFVELSDVLILTAVDNNLMEATRVIADQASRTLDTITREVLCGGTNVQYGNGRRLGRYALVGGDATAANNDYLTVEAVRKAARALKTQNARKRNGSYVGIIHPDAAFDLMSDPEWKYPHQYKDTANLYAEEIGEIGGVRFVESTEAKVFHAPDLTETDGDDAGVRTLTVASVSTKTVTIDEKLTTAQAAALVGRKVIIAGAQYNITAAAAGAAGAATFTVKETPAAGVADGAVVYPGEAGAAGRDVYATLIMGEDAYGVTEIEGGGLRHIVKQLGSGGTSDPLDQRSTVGWKASRVAERLVEQYMIRVETASTFEIGAN